MSASHAEWPRDRRRLVFWNGVCLSVLVLAGLVWSGSKYLQHTDQRMSAVTASWDGDALRFTSLRGFVVITHLVGVSGQVAVEAPLSRPMCLLDSGSVRMEKATLTKLDWRDEDGNKQPAPAVGSQIVGLYTRPDMTEWKGAK